MGVDDYGKISRIPKPYTVKNLKGETVSFSEFVKTRTQELTIEDTKKREENRKKLSYLTFLDKHTWYFKSILKLPEKQSKLFETIILIYIEKGLGKVYKVGKIGENYFEELKLAIKNISFEGVNQSDLASLLRTNQSVISQHFKALVKKGLIKQSGIKGKTKLYSLTDMDFLGYKILRSY